MKNKQTAVEWLASELLKDGFIIPIGYYFKAKAMEKKQIKEDYLQGIDSILEHRNEEEYYEETYGTPR